MAKCLFALLLSVFIYCLTSFTSSAVVSTGPSIEANHKKHSHKTSPLRIAVSANFSPILTQILPEFTRKHNIKVDIISGASGALYQQIIHGAPYDMFLSADDVHPKKLSKNLLIVKDSRQTYALGQLAFWSAEQAIDPTQNITDVLLKYKNNAYRVALANPNTAPYGNRAYQALQSLDLWQHFKNKIITGINVSQTFQQLRSGSVKGGFVALSQLKVNNLQGLTVPATLYSPIKQQLVILKRSEQINAAKKLAKFLQSNESQKIIERYGYETATQLKYYD